MTEIKGIILKCVGGCYTVEALDGVYQAKARGIFRKDGLKPMAGDLALLRLEESQEPVITEILPRKNYLVRPPLANLDLILLVASACEPVPNAFVLDKLIAVFESKGIETALIFTKSDKALIQKFSGIYREIGYNTFVVNNMTGEGCEGLLDYVSGKTSAVIGNSGVGKSSLMNYLLPGVNLKTAEISDKLGRGRHTTREAALHPLYGGGYIADTPGFSTVEVGKYGGISSAQLADYFVEFAYFSEKCRFKDCRHIKEAGCGVLQAVEQGKIARSRHESYCRLYEECRERERKY